MYTQKILHHLCNWEFLVRTVNRNLQLSPNRFSQDIAGYTQSLRKSENDSEKEVISVAFSQPYPGKQHDIPPLFSPKEF